MATKARRSSAKKKKSARSAKKRARKTAMRAGAKKGASKAASRRRSAARTARSAVARVKRVTRDVVQQATVAVSAGVDTLKDVGQNLVDRVRT